MPDGNVLTAILQLVQLIGIPVAIALYFLNQRKERLDREYGTYDALDDKYIEFLKLALQHSDLDVGEIPRKMAGTLTDDQRHRQYIILTVLVAILERAYLMYRDKSTALRKRQWEGWDAYIKDWCMRPNFVESLPQLQQQFDSGFVTYINSKIPKAQGRSS